MERNEEAKAMDEQEARARILLKSLLDQGAYERMSNIRISNPDLHSKLVSIITSIAQRGQIKKRITEDQLKTLIGQILSQRREGSIMRISK